MIAKDQLRTIVERIERLEEQKKTIADDIKDVYAEAKGTGFNVNTLRQLVRERKKTAEQRREQFELFDLYASAIGMEV